MWPSPWISKQGSLTCTLTCLQVVNLKVVSGATLTFSTNKGVHFFSMHTANLPSGHPSCKQRRAGSCGLLTWAAVSKFYTIFVLGYCLPLLHFLTDEKHCLLLDRRRDTHISVVEERTIPGFKKRLAAQTNKASWIGLAQFWVASVFLMTWPYRWLFRRQTTKANFTILKKIYLSPPPPEERNQVRTYNTQTTNSQLAHLRGNEVSGSLWAACSQQPWVWCGSIFTNSCRSQLRFNEPVSTRPCPWVL